MREAATPRVLCVGTHHKTGTVWMRTVFRALAAALDAPVLPLHRPAKWSRIPKEGRAVVLNWAGTFAPEVFAMPDARFLHVIRDPRDVLLSGARYHETTEMGTERDLARPRARFGGLSYLEAIRALPTFEEKLAFEMEGRHAEVLREMLAWPYGHPSAVDLRYEDLIVDTRGDLFVRALERLGLEEAERETGRRVFVENSLFGGKAADEGRQRTHVASGRPAQWLTKLPPATAALYAERHTADLIALGYEDGPGWTGRLAFEG
ncbi:hypothetical protein BCF33_1534 [Hasllibacter halocynthiae]|uniref:Sulfotransferase domain-containing protein n=1 Tax=Hasllibacter halocynthiae TaxID=595589 RepID=A0A2T0X165_9RHOB|nr:sulfotransferase [Hasllibacter halocynthiae]PRY92681.1 hypothetical protein BCF33_1534 [Hasllibacter halocynthiae]